VGAPVAKREEECNEAQRREAAVYSSLPETHQFSEEVIECAAEGIIVYDRELRYLVWNPFMERLTGRKAEEVLGKCALDLFPYLRENGMEAQILSLHPNTLRSKKELESQGTEFITDVFGDDSEAWAYFRGPDDYLHEIWQTERPVKVTPIVA
jgi:PAS domain S-box-containing protein